MPSRFWSRRDAAPGRTDLTGLPKPDTSLHPVGGVSGGRGPNQLRFLEHYGLQPSSRVLEIGCGVGRLAYELAPVLGDTGTYAGFDISPKAIGWLNEHYAPRLPNFRFDLVDARNVRYRPGRGHEAQSVRFPYGDEQFDVVCAFAVFMHMQLPEIAHYLEEIDRVRHRRGLRRGDVPCSAGGREAATRAGASGSPSEKASTRSSRRLPEGRSRTTTR